MGYCLKIIFLIAVLILHGILGAIGKIIFRFNVRRRLLYIASINKIILTMLGFIIGIHVKKSGKFTGSKNSVLYVGNHLSYLDVLAIGSCYPMIFVTSVDMDERKAEGWLTKNAGSVCVERRPEKLNLDILRKNINSIKEVIAAGIPLCIFPEATSANDSEELMFHSSLFRAFENSKTTIVPFSVKYLSIKGKPLTKENESIIYFYKGERFVPHIKKLLRYGNIEVRITVLESFGAENKNRKNICGLCKNMITENIKGAT